jgi:hypothetical protein
MGYLLNSGSGFLKDAVNVASDVKTYLINKGGYLYDTIRIGINDYGQRVLDDSGTIEGSSSAVASYKEITKTIFDASSLVLFPSGYKESKVYSHKPIDGTADFTYTRGTDTATRVNEQGLIEKESDGLTDSMPRIDHLGGTASLLLEPQRINQIVDSEDFSTANWDRQSCTVTSSATTSPDGTTNASKIVADNGTTNFRLRPTSATGVAGNNVHSVFVKHIKGGFDYIVLGSTNNQHRYAFNIKTGTKVGDIGANELLDTDVAIEDYGSGWYRCSIMVDSNGNSKFEIYLSDDGTGITATGDGTKGAYIWGAQTEQNINFLTSYIPTSGATATRAEDLATEANAIDADSDFTLMFEITPLTLLSTSHRYFNTGGDIGFLDNNADDQLRYRFDDTNYTMSLPNANAFKILFRKDSTDYKVYFNGSLAHTITTLPTGTQTLNLRGGKMKVCLLSTSALTTEQCEALTTNTINDLGSIPPAPVIPAAPSISGVPTISGTAKVGETLTATTASATGEPTPTTSWQWERSDNGTSGWASISGATSNTYMGVSADESKYLRVVQTETNTEGSDSANSASTAQVASAFSGILDDYTGATAAYSLRLLRSGYTGSAIRVRRSDDNAEQDIGFRNNELDTSTLETFSLGSDCFVVTWYDQSGSNNATQSTAANQAKIVSSGTTITEGGKPAVQFDGSNDYFTISDFTSILSKTNSHSSFSVHKANKVDGTIMASATGGADRYCLQYDTSNDAMAVMYYTGSFIRSATRNVNGNHNLFSEFWNTTEFTSFLNSTESTDVEATTTNATQTTTIGILNNGSQSAYGGVMQEIIVYPSNQSTNRSGIETNINDFYSIF